MSGDRILIDAHINQQPAQFVFDTGASFSALFATSAERLQVKYEGAYERQIANHKVQIGRSEPLDFAMFGQEAKIRLGILPLRRPVGFDGLLSWRNLTAPILLIDGVERKISTPQDLPPASWQRWKLEQDATQLFFEVTKDGSPLGRVFVDTGAVSGLRLAPPLWKAWRESQPNGGVTLETFQYAVGDAMVHEMAWADVYRLGDLTFYNVDIGPIPGAEEDRAVDAAGKEFVAAVGIRALRHLRMAICRPNNELLTQSVSHVPSHNRLGAVFVQQAERGSALVGYVLENSPAERIGLQSGDVLLEINGVDFRSPNGDSRPPPEFFFSMPTGTELSLKVERAEAVHEFSVKLQDLLP